jgi:hypothetical protein
MKVTTDDRIRLINGYNLEITELEPQDAGKPRRPRTKNKIINSIQNFHFTLEKGDYLCQISDKVNKDQVHTVEILGEFFVIEKIKMKTKANILWTLKIFVITRLYKCKPCERERGEKNEMKCW